MPIKCAGAPQKIAYLAADHLKQKGLLNESNLEFLCAKPVIFGVPHFQGPLNEICDSYGIKRSFQHNLVSINGDAKEAVFKALSGAGVSGLGWHHAEILSMLNGAPVMTLSGQCKTALEALAPDGYKAEISISLSDEPPYALAFVIINAVPLKLDS